MTGVSGQSGAEILARVRPRLAEIKTELCLRPDLLDTWQDAQDALEEHIGKGLGPNQRLAGTKPDTTQRDLAKRVQEIEAEIAAHAIVFTLRAMPPHEWRALCDNHPPRQGNQVDQIVGYNRDALLDAAVRRSLVDPVFDDCDDPDCDHEDCGSWQQFVATCNAGEWDELRESTNKVNRGVVESPKSGLASRILTRVETDS